MREIVFDTETTGLSPLVGDRMVEIGCVEIVNRVPTGATYHAYFNPCRPMPSDAEAVHGLTDAFLADKPLFPDLCGQLLAFIGDAPLVAHNAAFDFCFLNHELALSRRAPVCTTRMRCTVALARQRLPGAKHSLDALCTRYGIDRSIRVKHGALIDAQLLAEVYVELTGGRQIGLGLTPAQKPGERHCEAQVDLRLGPATGGPTIVHSIRPHAPTDVELVAHAAFLATLTDPLWHRLDRDG